MDIQQAALAEGKAWVFPDSNINTDLIMPAAAFEMRTEQEQARVLFRSYRPGWIDQVQPGDILIAGKNFGTGSGRPATRLMRMVGLRALVADSINDLFYRNCVNAALPAMECPGISAMVKEGNTVRVDVRAGKIEVVETGATMTGTAMPTPLLEIIAAGGLIEQLMAAGYLKR